MMNWCVRTPSPQFMRCAILLFATVCLFRGFGAGIVYFDNVDLPDLPLPPPTPTSRTSHTGFSGTITPQEIASYHSSLNLASVCRRRNLSEGPVRDHLVCALHGVGFPPTLREKNVAHTNGTVSVATYLSHWGARGRSDMTCFSLYSLLAHGIVPQIHGMTEPVVDATKAPEPDLARRKGFLNKAAALVDLTAAYPRDMLLVIYDAVDVLMMRGDERAILERYLTLTGGARSIVVSTEKLLIAKMCGAGFTPGAYPNTGLWMGPAGLLHDLFKFLRDVRQYLVGASRVHVDKFKMDYWAFNDQTLFTCLYHRMEGWADNIVLDAKSILFQSMFDGTRPLVQLNYDVMNYHFSDSYARTLWKSRTSAEQTNIAQRWLKWFTVRNNAKFHTTPIFFHFNVVRDHILVAFDLWHVWLPKKKKAAGFRVGTSELPMTYCAKKCFMSKYYKYHPRLPA